MSEATIILAWAETVADHDKWNDDFKRPDLSPGVAWWGRGDDGQIRRLQYICPCGCSDWRCISVCPGEPLGGGVWGWDGNEVAPTLKPSIKHMGGRPGHCTWHGFLVNGAWRGQREDPTA